jgi:gliding motility-associated-like protein
MNPIDPKKLFIRFLFTIVIMCSYHILSAQSLGDPIVDITFGSGTATRSGALPADSGTTTYIYSSSGFPSDDYYTIANTTAGMFNGWWTTTDHTGNTDGYMMIVNGSYDPGIFYTRTVTGLCGNTTYQFAAWIKNLLNYSGILPNVTFSIETTTGTVLGTGNTGDIATGNVWIQYPFTFTVPASASTVVIKMTNNAPGGIGNDIAIDDITFRPYGSQVSATFAASATTQSLCAGNSQSETVNVTTALASGYEQKLQEEINGVWTDESVTSTASSFTFTSPSTAGTYLYRVVSGLTSNIGSSECVVSSNELTLTINPAPVPMFSVSNTECLGNATVFTDQSTSTLAISSWLWNFGDGSTSILQSPTHTYTVSGTYTVTLTVTNSGGCSAISTSQTIQINAQAVAEFTYSSPACTGQPVTFTDASTSADGSILKWIWDYGDGEIDTLLNNATHTHTYITAGTYTATLQVASASGCLSNMSSQAITVNPLPVANFSMPDVCLSDAYAQFTDESTIADGTQSSFSYLWTFGDANATAADPNTSTAQNPQHKYSAVGNYNVTLTVTSKYGCVSSAKTHVFTVNGAIPQAGFTVENSNNLCSSDSVTFDNTSTVDFGSITKIVFYYDYNNLPTDSSVYYKDSDQIPSNNKFSHNYGAFNTPLTKSYDVRMVVYSGETCFSTFDNTITINANPIVTLSTLGSLCQDGTAVQISEDKNGFTGTGVFSGTGVSSTGLFDPSKSGVGTFNINYLFTDVTGCTYPSSQSVTVNASPTITLPSTYTLLSGGQITLDAKATGDSLTYQWTPATGLSNATALNPIANPITDMQYQLTVTTANGCTAAAIVEVLVLKAPVVPNTFTPNGDGINDTWQIKYLDSYPDCTVSIFNRYGQRLFYSVGYPNPWDGNYNGSPVPAGVYYYIIDPKHGRSPLSGSLTILR